MRKSFASGTLDIMEAATTLANGAILIDEYDPIIFDDILRRYPAWNRIDRRLAPGETTGGFEQTAISTGRTAPVRDLGCSPTSPTRAARTRRDIKAIIAQIKFGIFDRSVYQQQGRRFGDLKAKDVADLSTAVLRKWQDLFYNGSVSDDPTEFDGLATLLSSSETIDDNESVLNGINGQIVAMMNTSAKDVMPTAIYTNARVVYMIEQELFKVGNKLQWSTYNVGPNIFNMPVLMTPAGMLPLIADPFNGVTAGTPNVYNAYIVSEDRLSWQYVEPLGQAGAEPKTFEVYNGALDCPLDLEFTTVMFGALELLGGTSHHRRVLVEDRTTIVDPTT